MSWIDQLRFDSQGLLPVIAQEAGTGEVLMLAWTDRDALEHTVRTGQMHYWSRSRQALWRKGETTGHVQKVRELRVDCDGDALLALVEQTGPACHTLESSCFHRAAESGELVPAPAGGHVLARVEEIVRTREADRPDGSYTTYLFDQGIDKILKKVGEEAAEIIIAAKNADAAELRSESADLLFHLLVLLRARGIPLAEIWSEMDRRFGAPPRQNGRVSGATAPASGG